MNDMIVIDNEIVPVYQTDTGEKVVYGSELHKVLGSPSTYREWAKRRLSDIDAVEKNDFEGVEISTPSGQTKKDHIIKLDSAKEMAMLERNEIGKKVRKHFIEIENRYKQQIIDRSQLSPQTQLILSMSESIAKTELEQKRQAEKIEKLEYNQKALADTFSAQSDTEDFQAWANKCIARIAESPMFNKGVGRNSRYAYARNESYERLKKKWNCNLDDRVARAKGRAMERNPGITKAELNAINKLTVIANDKSLRPVYETVLKEMMIQYCVEVPI